MECRRVQESLKGAENKRKKSIFRKKCGEKAEVSFHKYYLGRGGEGHKVFLEVGKVTFKSYSDEALNEVFLKK